MNERPKYAHRWTNPNVAVREKNWTRSEGQSPRPNWPKLIGRNYRSYRRICFQLVRIAPKLHKSIIRLLRIIDLFVASFSSQRHTFINYLLPVEADDFGKLHINNLEYYR